MNIIARIDRKRSGGSGRHFGLMAETTSPAMAATPLNIAAEARLALLARGYNATGQQLFAQFSAGARQHRVLALFDRGGDVDGARRRARRHRDRDDAGPVACGCRRKRSTPANAEVLSVLNGYDRSTAPPACPPGATLVGRNCEMRPAGDMANQCRYGLLLQGRAASAPAQMPPSAQLLAANALMLHKGGDVDRAGLHRAPQDEVCGGSVPTGEPRRHQRLGRAQDRGHDPADARPARSRRVGGAARCRLFQGALGVGFRQEAHQGRAVPSRPVAAGRRRDDEPEREISRSCRAAAIAPCGSTTKSPISAS